MANRSLTVEISSAGLTVMQAADQVVAIVKSATNPRYAVVWQVIYPTRKNAISWDGTHQVYASATPLAPGRPIDVAAAAPATGGETYSFAGGQFGGGTGNLAPAHIGMSNQDARFTVSGVAMFTGGASATAQLNGKRVNSPLDAQAVLYKARAYSVLTEQVLVFPASGVAAGTLLDRSWLSPAVAAPRRTRSTAEETSGIGIVLGTPLEVDLTTNTSQTIHYVDADNRFGPGPLP